MSGLDQQDDIAGIMHKADTRHIDKTKQELLLIWHVIAQKFLPTGLCQAFTQRYLLEKHTYVLK